MIFSFINFLVYNNIKVLNNFKNTNLIKLKKEFIKTV